MIIHSALPQFDETTWEPSEHALHLGAYGTEDGDRRPVVMACHPTAPFIGATGGGVQDEKRLQRIAHDYLSVLANRFDARYADRFPQREKNFLPRGWLDALDPDASRPFGWLPLVSLGVVATNPVTSRVRGRGTDRTIILVAGDPFASSFGVRVVMRVIDAQAEFVAISSLSAHLPHAPYVTWLELQDAGRVADYLDDPDIRTRLATATGQQEDMMSLAEVRAISGGQDAELILDVTTYGPGRPLCEHSENSGFGTTFAAVTRLSFEPSPKPQVTARWPLHSNAMGRAGGGDPGKVTVPVFKDDPVSRKRNANSPTSSFGEGWPSSRLNGFRDPAEIDRVLETVNFRILKCPDFAEQDAGSDPTEVREIDLRSNAVPDPRSDDQSAISAYYACYKFFEMIEAFGLAPGSLFRRVERPLRVHYRSSVRPGPGKDGRTVNARVEIADLPRKFLPPQNGRVHMHLALGNLNRWFREVPPDGPLRARRAQPLGIANSRRWVHHEIGHVLIAAALGELELRFVHSIGDSLAAILGDPTSRFGQAEENRDGADFRYQTFPWVFATRRHDRSVLTGWSWSGTMHRGVRDTPEKELRGLKGYQSEQILSTTLFRLYRCLGGDTLRPDGKPDVPARRRAALVTLYLLVTAVDSFAHPPLRAEELECAMIDADLGLTSRLSSVSGEIWTGGQAHKAVRWAFEAQGLHPTDAGCVNNAPGGPPPVDLYIKDRRSGIERTFAGDVDHGEGSYMPVSLQWNAQAGWVGEWVSGGILVGNRGTLPADGVQLRGWFGLNLGDDISWQPAPGIKMTITDQVSTEAPLYQEISVDDGWQTPTLAEVVLLIEATAPGDRANTDPAAMLACAIPEGGNPPTLRQDIIDLVANDNNLGLFWVKNAGD